MGLATRELLGRGSVYSLATALSMGSALFMLPFVTRALSLADFGTVALAAMFGQLLGLVANSALPAAITRAYFLDDGRRQAAARLVIDGAACATVVTVSLALTSPWWWTPLLASSWSEASAFAVIYGGLLSVVHLLLAFLRAVERPWAFVFTASTSSVGGVLAGLTLCLMVEPSAVMYLGGVCAAQLVSVVNAACWSRLTPFEGGPGRGYRRRALAVALPTIPHLLALQGFVVGLRVVVQADSGAESVARFHVGYTVGSLGIVLLSALNNAWAPLVFKARPADRERILAETTKVVLQVVGTAAAVTVLASPLLLALMAPAEYNVAGLVPVTVIVALAGPLYALYLAHMHVITAGARTGGLAVTTPLATALALGTVLWMPHTGPGLLAAATGVPLFYALVALAVRSLARRVGPMTLPYGRAVTGLLFIAACGLWPVFLPQSVFADVTLVLLSGAALAGGIWSIFRTLRAGEGLSRLP